MECSYIRLFQLFTQSGSLLLLGSASKAITTLENRLERNNIHQILHNPVLKKFTSAVLDLLL